MTPQPSTGFPFKIKLMFVAFVLSLLLCVLNTQFATPETLTETLMLSASAIYLLSRMEVSAIVRRYQDTLYAPAKWLRRGQDLVVTTLAKVVMPLCLNMVLATAILILIKYLHLSRITGLGAIFGGLMDFDHLLKYPLLIGGIILAALTLLNFMPEKKYKKLKLIKAKVTSPLKVIAIVTLFLSADKGPASDHLLYQISREEVKGAHFGSDPTPEQQKKAQAAAKVFTDAVVDAAFQNSPPDSASTHAAIPSPVFLKTEFAESVDFLEAHPKYQDKFLPAGPRQYTRPEQQEVSGVYKAAFREKTVKKAPTFEKTNLYRKAKEHSGGFYDELMTNLRFEPETIGEESSGSVLKDMLKDYFGDAVGGLFHGVIDKAELPGVTGYSIMKDAAIDGITEHLKKSFSYVMSQKTISKEELQDIVTTTAGDLKKEFKTAFAFAAERAALLHRYTGELQDMVVEQTINTFDHAHPTEDIDYVQGLDLKQDMNKAGQDDKMLEQVRKDYKNYIEKKWPDLSAENKQATLDNAMQKYRDAVNADIANHENVVNNKEYSDFDFIRDKFTSGGIFFGRAITNPDTGTAPATGLYFPGLPQKLSSAALALPSAVWIRKIKGKFYLFIRTDRGEFSDAQPVDSALLATAYRFVYDKDTYPSLIDMFYKYDANGKNPVSVPAYHEAFIHNNQLKELFRTADSFIFDMLHSKINSPMLARDLSLARQNYKISAPLHTSGIQCYSRLYDESYILTTGQKNTFLIHANITFSVVSTVPKDQRGGSARIYNELNEVSSPINQHKAELIAAYSYLISVHEFAGYQALFRTVPKKNTEVLALFAGAK